MTNGVSCYYNYAYIKIQSESGQFEEINDLAELEYFLKKANYPCFFAGFVVVFL